MRQESRSKGMMSELLEQEREYTLRSRERKQSEKLIIKNLLKNRERKWSDKIEREISI